MSKEVAPHLVMQFLNELFSKFDHLCDVHSVYKVRSEGVFCLNVQVFQVTVTMTVIVSLQSSRAWGTGQCMAGSI